MEKAKETNVVAVVGVVGVGVKYSPDGDGSQPIVIIMKADQLWGFLNFLKAQGPLKSRG